MAKCGALLKHRYDVSSPVKPENWATWANGEQPASWGGNGSYRNVLGQRDPRGPDVMPVTSSCGGFKGGNGGVTSWVPGGASGCPLLYTVINKPAQLSGGPGSPLCLLLMSRCCLTAPTLLVWSTTIFRSSRCSTLLTLPARRRGYCVMGVWCPKLLHQSPGS